MNPDSPLLRNAKSIAAGDMNAQSSASNQKQNAKGSWTLLLAVLFLLSTTLICRPFEFFPLNDEWAYGYPIQSFLSSGKFVFPSTTTFAIAQIVCAVPLCLVFGFSFTLLRILGLAFGILACFALYKVLREMRLTRNQSGLFALAFASSPFVICLSNSFMTDIPSIAFNFLLFLFVAKAIKTDSTVHWCLSSLFLSCSIGCRQTALIFLPALACVILMRAFHKKRIVLPSLCMFLVPIFVYFCLDHFVKASSLFPAPATAYQSALLETVRNGFHSPLKSLAHIWQSIGISACYMALLTFPLLLTISTSALMQKNRKPVLYASLFALLLVGLPLGDMIFLKGQYMPFAPNLFSAPFLGAYCLVGQFPASPSDFWTKWFTWFTVSGAVAYVAILSSAILIALRDFRLSQLRRSISFSTYFGVFNIISFFSILSFLVLQTSVHNLDRYYLFLLPNTLCLLAFLWRPICNRGYQLWLCLALCLAIGAFGIVECLDYHNYSRTKEKCISFLEKKMVPPKSIDGGPEYNLTANWDLLRSYKFDPLNPHLSKYLDEVRGAPETRNMRWWPVTSEDYLISVQELPGYKTSFASHYWSPLLCKKVTIFALQKNELTNQERN